MVFIIILNRLIFFVLELHFLFIIQIFIKSVDYGLLTLLLIEHFQINVRLAEIVFLLAVTTVLLNEWLLRSHPLVLIDSF